MKKTDGGRKDDHSDDGFGGAGGSFEGGSDDGRGGGDGNGRRSSLGGLESLMGKMSLNDSNSKSCHHGHGVESNSCCNNRIDITAIKIKNKKVILEKDEDGLKSSIKYPYVGQTYKESMITYPLHNILYAPPTLPIALPNPRLAKPFELSDTSHAVGIDAAAASPPINVQNTNTVPQSATPVSTPQPNISSSPAQEFASAAISTPIRDECSEDLDSEEGGASTAQLNDLEEGTSPNFVINDLEAKSSNRVIESVAPIQYDVHTPESQAPCSICSHSPLSTQINSHTDSPIQPLGSSAFSAPEPATSPAVLNTVLQVPPEFEEAQPTFETSLHVHSTICPAKPIRVVPSSTTEPFETNFSMPRVPSDDDSGRIYEESHYAPPTLPGRILNESEVLRDVHHDDIVSTHGALQPTSPNPDCDPDFDYEYSPQTVRFASAHRLRR